MRRGDALVLNPEDCGWGLREHAANDGCGELGIVTDVRPLQNYSVQNKACLLSVQLENGGGVLDYVVSC